MVLAVAGCHAGAGGSEASSSSSTTPTSSTASLPALTPAPPAPPPAGQPATFRDYLASINVTGQPTPFDKATGLSVTVPVPDGWARTGDPMFSTGIEYVQPTGSAGSLPSVTLMAIRLIGDFDPREAIKHANLDALPPGCTDVTESFDDYDGFPSAAAQGTLANAEHYSRIVLADVPSASARYLVQMTVTTKSDQPIAQSPPLSEIVSGFKVAVS
ncbi:putative lipoprotein LpqT [Mycolicibacterium madagascariense]|uniref:Putative lipoprotein LpqT n=2 Tax=Mycolicibacterium madagascariense TaxID=212765 RepID=A0A7I7XM00_9MYCO|nr:putative lipoprotein LpqT [Mycolicibacterium madagascariense]